MLVSKDHIDTRYRLVDHAMVYTPVREKMLGKYDAVMVSVYIMMGVLIRRQSIS